MPKTSKRRIDDDDCDEDVIDLSEYASEDDRELNSEDSDVDSTLDGFIVPDDEVDEEEIHPRKASHAIIQTKTKAVRSVAKKKVPKTDIHRSTIAGKKKKTVIGVTKHLVTKHISSSEKRKK